MPEELLRPGEAAAELRLTEKTILDWLRRGKLSGVKVGPRWRVRRSDLEAFKRGEQPGAAGKRGLEHGT